MDQAVKTGTTKYIETNQSFSGCDMAATIDITLPNGKNVVQGLGELQTITYSIFMDKSPVRAVGNVNAKDYVYGPRTIAGSLMFAVLNRHWAYNMLENIKQAGGMGTVHYLVDELLPFNLTVSFRNEYGVSARLALYGVRIVSEGQTMSINDIYTENTYQFTATDIDYLTATTGWTSQKIPAKTQTTLSSKPTDIADPVNKPVPVTPPVDPATAQKQYEIDVMLGKIQVKRKTEEVIP